MKIQHLIPILFLAAFCTVSAQTNNATNNFFSADFSILPSPQTVDRHSPHHTGTVRYPSGEPAAGVLVTLYPGVSYEDDDYNYREAITDKDGHYDIIPPRKISRVRTGWVIRTYHIMARDIEKNYAAVKGFPDATTNVDVDLQPAITLSGSVKNTKGAAFSGAGISIRFTLPQNGLDRATGIEMKTTFEANKQGQFSIPALPQGIEYNITGIAANGHGYSLAGVKPEDTRTNHYEFPTFVL